MGQWITSSLYHSFPYLWSINIIIMNRKMVLLFATQFFLSSNLSIMNIYYIFTFDIIFLWIYINTNYAFFPVARCHAATTILACFHPKLIQTNHKYMLKNIKIAILFNKGTLKILLKLYIASIRSSLNLDHSALKLL